MPEVAVSLGQAYAPISEDLRLVETIFDEELSSEWAFVDQLCDRVLKFRGKMLRPALLLLVARACGRITPVHHTLAAVMEMVHIATLVHDDVLDQADVRRRHNTVNATYGNVTAVLLGDYLISHAFHLCSSLDSQFASRLVGATTNVVCEGELVQNHHVGDVNMDEETYYQIIRCKTAALTATACHLGAFCARADDDVVQAMRAYGQLAGVAFQIVDDILDIIGSSQQMGKTLGRDCYLGKPTLPLIHCLANADPTTRSRLSQIIQGQLNAEPDEISEVLQSTGSIDYAFNAAKEHVDKSIAKLNRLVPSDAKSSLTAMAEFIITRSL